VSVSVSLCWSVCGCRCGGSQFAVVGKHMYVHLYVYTHTLVGIPPVSVSVSLCGSGCGCKCGGSRVAVGGRYM